ncbi:MAG TPA: DUF2298 domain-containing protein, partial [Anaerolineales bacterium]|nr:DUF2298 domain-containing protein [Anaerolineales bacterium]
MTAFISWYILITLLGWVMFPLAYRLFPALADRGYTLSRAFGLMLWGFVFWMFATFGIAQNDLGGLLLGLIVLGGLSAWAYFTQYEASSTQLAGWLQENRKLILTTEILFIVAFGFMAFFRSANPEILGTEKPMELMFINGIMNSPTFPPRDLWLSGYSISYYYFGYVMTAMLATFTGVPATMAFNLMLALIFGMAAVGAYGILYNLLVTGRKSNDESREIVNTCTWRKCRCRKSSIVNSLLAPLFLLLISNAEGFLEVLHARGLFWKDGSNFWTWLDIKEINVEPAPLAGRVFERLGYWWNQKAISEVPPPQAANWLSQTAYWMDLKFTLLGRWFAEQFLPDRYWWWWRASRVVQDYDLLRNPLEAIDEFPAFSFLLGDLHPHVLAIPFFLLAIAFALNLFLGGFRGQIDLYIGRLHISKTGFFLAAFMLGGMAFLNTWDILPIAAVIVFSYVLARVHEAGWGRERLEDILLFGIPVLVTAYVMYLPFFISFDSQASGIIPNFMYITRGAQLWVMWGTLFIPIFAFLIHLVRTKLPAAWGKGIVITLGFVIVLIAVMMVMGFLGYKLKPEVVLPILEGQGRDANTFIADSFTLRLNHIGSLLTLMALLIPVLSFLFAYRRQEVESPLQLEWVAAVGRQPSVVFVLLLIALGALLILSPDFLYLSDNFGYRINTIFKFYYQAWLLI